jgi:hypothetical protein
MIDLLAEGLQLGQLGDTDVERLAQMDERFSTQRYLLTQDTTAEQVYHH